MFLESKVRPVRRADNLGSICEPILHNVRSLTSQNPMCLQGLDSYILRNMSFLLTVLELQL
jgi:hypothetical protein